MRSSITLVVATSLVLLSTPSWGSVSSRPSVSVLGSARCGPASGPTQKLRILFRSVATSCAPGGPCSNLVGGDLSPKSLRLVVKGCQAPLRGRFVASGQRCGKSKVLVWRGELPRGQTFDILRVGTSDQIIARAQSSGRTSTYRCPAVVPDGAPLRYKASKSVGRTTLRRGGFRLEGTEQQARWRLSYRHATTAHVDDFAALVDSKELDKVLAGSRGAEPQFVDVVITTRRIQELRTMKAGRRRFCRDALRTELEMAVTGTEWVLKSQRLVVYNRSHGPCPKSKSKPRSKGR